jgi:RNA polymerase sigma-70 factor (ECF subfamily)
MLTPAELVWLIAAVAKGDEAAFERLYAATRAKLYGVVLRILRRQDLAEEVIQDTYIKIWNSAGQFNPALASPITWMASIARNRAIDLVRKKSELSIEEEPAAMEVAADSPDPLARREMTEEPNASAGSSRTARSSCCSHTTTAGAGSSSRRSSRRR